MLLFVYGTLKEGYHNHHYLEEQELVEKDAETEPHYRLFDNGIFPMMIEDRRKGYSVKGEVWEVDEDQVDVIDMHEALYERQEIDIEGFDEPVHAYIYLEKVDHDFYFECYGEWG